MSVNATSVATDGVDITYQTWESNMLNSNDIINRFFEYYGESTEQGVQFPDYYAGFEIQNDGTLVLHSTDVSEDMIESVYEICQTDDFAIQEALYSFSELKETADNITGAMMDANNIECVIISIPNNRVNVYVAEVSGTSASSVVSNISNDDQIELCFFTSIADAAITAAYPDGYQDPDTFVGSPTISRIGGSEASTTATTTTLKYGALGYSNSQNGTVGYLALDSSGNKILVTHGHDLSSNKAYYYGGSGGTNVGTVTVLGTSDELDASVVVLNTNTTITNQADWTNSSQFTSAISTNSSLLSLSGEVAYYYGAASGSERESLLSGIKSSDGYYFYLRDVFSVSGDSGGPVYTKSTSGLKLLGIVKGWDSGGTKIISVPTIKSAYSHYVYLNSSSYT